MRALLVLALLTGVLLASCVPLQKLNLKLSEDTLLKLDNLLRVYIEKIGTEVIVLKPKNIYQKVLYSALVKQYKMAKESYKIAHDSYLKQSYSKALVLYLKTMYHVISSQMITNFITVTTLNGYVELLNETGSLAEAAAFSLYKAGCGTGSCINTTRVVYVLVYPKMIKTIYEVKKLIYNIPNYFDSYMALEALKLVNETSKMLVLSYAHFLISGTKGLSDITLERVAKCPLKALGNAPWLPKACYYYYFPVKQTTQCSSFFAYVSLYIGLKDLAQRLCGGFVG